MARTRRKTFRIERRMGGAALGVRQLPREDQGAEARRDPDPHAALDDAGRPSHHARAPAQGAIGRSDLSAPVPLQLRHRDRRRSGRRDLRRGHRRGPDCEEDDQSQLPARLWHHRHRAHAESRLGYSDRQPLGQQLALLFLARGRNRGDVQARPRHPPRDREERAARRAGRQQYRSRTSISIASPTPGCPRT